jgi:hypothetical protein
MLRSVWLRNEAARSGFDNNGTVCAGFDQVWLTARRPTTLSFEQLFRRHYAALRELVHAHRAPGLALLVAGAERLEATAWMPAEEEGVNPVIVGRHSTAELFLPWDPALSLRHLAVIVRRGSDSATSYRVLDLRTPTAFGDEQGHRLRALDSAGPTLVRCASFALLLFPTDATSGEWPEDADAGWRRVPERVHLEAASADSESWSRPGGVVVRAAPVWADARATTSVVTFPGPVFLAPVSQVARPAALDVGSARGELLVSAPTGGGSLLLDAEAARRGALIGRYERCDGFGLPCLDNPALSRVHLLVVESEGALWAIDTASKNGSWLGSERIRRTRLEAGRRLSLAGCVAVEWCPFH